MEKLEQWKKITQDVEYNKKKYFTIMLVVAITTALIIGALCGSYITIHSVNSAFDSAKVKVCTTKDIQYDAALSELALCKQKPACITQLPYNLTVN